jgi:hypothetical protein
MGGSDFVLTAADTVPLAILGGTRRSRTGQSTAPAASARTKPVFVYRLVAQGIVEQRMLKLQQRK